MQTLKTNSDIGVSYLGPEGTYTHLATTEFFGPKIDLFPCTSIKEVFDNVFQRDARYGVVPIENSYVGSVRTTMQMLMTSPLLICGEVEMPIHHNLLSKSDNLQKIKSIYAHPQALAQCDAWLESSFKNIQTFQTLSNAEAAIKALNDSSSAAIASKFAAKIYKLNVIATNIEDHDENTTRFAVIGTEDTDKSKEDKTSLIFSAIDAKGAGVLHDLLYPLSKHKISMTRIESLPSMKRKWDYVFFVDIQGHRNDELVAEAVSEIERKANFFKILGSYKQAR
tara:strand:+ start:12574 stop:13416 length:843 start_codon:yes stop_codon:yes gene_type:complete